jgi:hypothetical protein
MERRGRPAGTTIICVLRSPLQRATSSSWISPLAVAIAIATPLKEFLAATPKLSPVILLNSKGKAWTSHGFSSLWRKTCKKAGVAGVTFNDLRGTFVTRAALNERGTENANRAANRRGTRRGLPLLVVPSWALRPQLDAACARTQRARRCRSDQGTCPRVHRRPKEPGLRQSFVIAHRTSPSRERR